MTAPVPPTPPSDFSELTSALSALNTAIPTLTTAMETLSTSFAAQATEGIENDDKLFKQLENRSDGITDRLSTLETELKNTKIPGQLKGTADLIATSNSDIRRRMGEMVNEIDAQKKILEGSSDETVRAAARQKLVELSREYKEHQTTLKNNGTQFKDLTSEIGKVRKNITESLGEKFTNAIGDKLGLEGEDIRAVMGKFAKVAQDAMKMANEGIQKAAELSLTAQEGVALEFNNQWTAIKSAFTFDANRVVSKEQLYATQQGLVEGLQGISKGLELDPDKIGNLVSDMRTGLNSQIVPTAETFRSLAQAGIKPTQDSMNALREASGRASLGINQMNVLSKNTAALQIFGMGIAKTTLDLERMGISITSVMAAAEGYVTNLDGAIDTIAQLNQMGVGIDFGELTQLQEFDPAAAIKYVADRISPEQLQSSSFRAMLKGLPGIDMNEVLKVKGMANLDELESGVTKQADATSAVTNAMTSLTLGFNAVTGTFLGLITSTISATVSLFALAAAAGSAAAANVTSMVTRLTSSLAGVTIAIAPFVAAIVAATAGIMVGASLIDSGAKKVKEGNTAGGILSGGAGGGLMVGALMAALAIAFPPSIPFLMIAAPWLMGAGVVAGGATSYAKGTADDIYSPAGYGERKLVTPTQTYSLNNSDDVMAGTRLLPKDTLQAGRPQGGDPELVRAVRDLVSTIRTASTTINVNGSVQTVPRSTLATVGVYSRNERT